jgi:Holliday junction resolvasome RuvABC endonuclease subunit
VKVLALDPGAKRLGWAVLYDGNDGSPRYHSSGIWTSERKDSETYQGYRLRAMSEAGIWIDTMTTQYLPDEVVMETIPVRGFNDMGQAYLALSVISAMSGVCATKRVQMSQIGATTVKARIGGSNKASKVRVRNTVWQVFPALQSKAPEWKKVYDESDAIAIGLTRLGYTRPK